MAYVNARAAERSAELDASGTNGGGGASTPAPTATCPVNDDETGVCVVCGDKFEKFFDSDREEWMYRDAVRVDGQLYHPGCQDDASTVWAGGRGAARPEAPEHTAGPIHPKNG